MEVNKFNVTINIVHKNEMFKLATVSTGHTFLGASITIRILREGGGPHTPKKYH